MQKPLENTTESQFSHMNTNYSFNSYNFDYVQNFVFYENFLLPEQCDDIIDVAKKLEKFDGQSTDEKNNYRDCKTSFMSTNDIPWLFDELAYSVQEANKQYFNFDLWGFAEGLQFTEYNTPGGHYKIHCDKIHRSRVRKLSCIIQLTEEEDYDGCDVELILNEPFIKLPKTKGTLIIFPSYTPHRVTPITRGTRYSLVAWINGKPFT